MMEKQLIPVGYKQTEVGVIPDIWDVKKIADIASVTSGGTPNRENKDYWNGDIPWVTTSLIDGEVITGAYEFITEVGLKNSATKWFDKDTVLIAMYGQGKTRGKVGILGINATINQACAGINLNGDVEVHFFFHYLKSQYHSLRELSNSGGQENLSGTIVKSIKIPIPPKLEQTAIANALSDVDALIAVLEKLINKKIAIKTASMQQLLTGKKRLPPFDQLNTGYKQTELGEIPGDWECVPSNIAINFFCGYGFSSRAATTTGIKWLKISNVGINEIKWDAESYLPATFIDEFKEFSLAPNDIVMALTRPILGDQLKVARINKSDVPVLLNQRVAKLEAKSFNGNDFLYYVVQRLNFVSAMNLAMAGSDPPNIGTASLGKIKIIIPNSREEQTAIANVLSDMDKDLEALQQRLHKTQQIKQGMMQELLTGKTRLI